MMWWRHWLRRIWVLIHRFTYHYGWLTHCCLISRILRLSIEADRILQSNWLELGLCYGRSRFRISSLLQILLLQLLDLRFLFLLLHNLNLHILCFVWLCIIVSFCYLSRRWRCRRWVHSDRWWRGRRWRHRHRLIRLNVSCWNIERIWCVRCWRIFIEHVPCFNFSPWSIRHIIKLWLGCL